METNPERMREQSWRGMVREANLYARGTACGSFHNLAGGLASHLHERGIHNLSCGVYRLISTGLPASTALDVTRDLCSASRTEPSKDQIATLYGAAEIDYRRAGCALPAPNVRQQPLTKLLRNSLPEARRLVTETLRSRVAGSNGSQF